MTCHLYGLTTNNWLLSLRRGGDALAEIPVQPEKREIETRVEDVVIDFLRGEILRNVRAGGGHKSIHRVRIAAGGSPGLLGERRPAMKPFAEQQDVLGRVFRETEVREEQPLGLALKNRREGSFPDSQVDVRRWSRGHRVGIAFDAHPCRIADESGAFLMIEVADVVRSMAWGVNDFEFVRADGERFAALEDAQILLGNRKSLPEQLLQVLGPQALGAG